MPGKNCWEIMACGYGPSGDKAKIEGLCAVATETRLNGINYGKNGGRACWIAEGTVCTRDRKGYQTDRASRLEYCRACKAYKLIAQEEGDNFKEAADIIEVWDKEYRRNENILAKILIPIIVAFSILVLATFLSIHYSQQQTVRNLSVKNIEMIRTHFEQEETAVTEKLTDIMAFVKVDTLLQQAFKNRDREGLLSFTEPLQRLFIKGHELTLFNFYTPDKTCFLRIFNPDHFGDKIHKTVLDLAKSSEKAATGIEIGKYGTLNLLVIHPWLIDGEIAGYIELGMEIDYVIPNVAKMLDADLLVAIDKRYLSEESWQKRQELMGRNEDWNRFADFVVTTNTMETVPDDIADHLANKHTSHKNSVYKSLDGLTYYTSFIPITDAAGRNVGDLVSFTNVSPIVRTMNMSALSIVLFITLLGGLLVLFFYHFIGRIQAGITENNDQTITEILERQRAEERERLARQQAENASAAKSDFLANMSHEIRTPITGALGMINLTLDTKLTDQQREYLYMAKTATNNLMNLINDILDLSKIEAEKLIIEQVDFSLTEIIKSATNSISCLANEKGLELITKIDVVPDYLNGDPGRLHQIVLNLVGNALKFTETGTITVSCSLLENDPNSHPLTLQISVQDTGIGIAKENQEKIFKSFQQADASTTRKFGGSGLGLSICDKLIRLMGGTFWLESEPNKGSVFSFTVKVGKGDKEKLTRRQEKTRRAEFTKLQGLKALVAEDEKIIREIEESFLKDAGCQVVAVENGKEALNQIEANQFDFLIMDLQMPVMDGFELVSKIRESEQGTNKHLPIIAVTAQAFVSDLNKCLSHGADSFLTKPFENENFLGTIQKTILQVEKPCGQGTKKAYISPIFDAASALKRNDNDQAKVDEAVSRFIQQAEFIHAELAEEAKSEKLQTLEQSSSNLKAIANQAGAARCADQLLKLELHLRKKRLSLLQTDVDNIGLAIAEYVEQKNNK